MQQAPLLQYRPVRSGVQALDTLLPFSILQLSDARNLAYLAFSP
jgi:hypothetical protein